MKHTSDPSVITPEELKEHWQGHRRLTRRMIEAFPEKELFEYSVGGMRPFAQLARELMGLAGMGMRGIITGKWDTVPELDYHKDKPGPRTKQELLHIWDKVTVQIDEQWPQLTSGRFRENIKAFGLYEGTVWGSIFYWIDNENHHRGQGYVYLRSLNITPPAFWER